MRSSLPFFENQKKCLPWLRKKGADYVYPWVKELQNIFLWGLFSFCFWQNVYQSTLYEAPQNLPFPEKFLVAHLHSGIILFAKCSISNVWQCSKHNSILITVQKFVEWAYAMYCIKHIQNFDIFRTLFIQVYAGIFKHIHHY